MRSERFPCLSVRQPWADLIASGIKDVENRSWSTGFRGRILIHASRNVDVAAVPRLLGLLGLASASLYSPTTGALVGLTTIVDCVTDHPSRFFTGPYGFVLEDSRVLPEPIPLAGRLGIFTVPAEILPRSLRTLAGGFGSASRDTRQTTD